MQTSSRDRPTGAFASRVELYDPRNDPHQIDNVASKDEYRDIKDTLHQQLMTELQAKRDPRLQDDAFDFLPYNLQEGID